MTKNSFCYLIILFFLFTSCEGPEGPEGPKGVDGQDGIDGVDDEILEFYFTPQDADYGEFEFVSIQNQEPVGNFEEGFFTDQIILSSNVDFTNTGHKSRSLIKFGNLGNKIFDKLPEEETFKVREAIIYIYNVVGITDSKANSIKLGTLAPDQPDFDVQNTNWKMANEIDNWEVLGVIDPLFSGQLFATFSSNTNRYDDTFVVPPTQGNNLELGWIPLRLNSRAVEGWIDDDNNNKGSILILGNEFADQGQRIQFQFISNFNEHSIVLYVKLEKSITTGRVGSNHNDWSSLSLEEKLRPLRRFLDK